MEYISCINLSFNNHNFKQIIKEYEESTKNIRIIILSTLKLDYERLKQIEKECEEHFKNYKFIPLWNPHTEG
jgi:F0F1-type ATP synthase delta subunit